MMTFTPDQWIIVALVFVLGLLIGIFMTAGGRKKWKTRYHDEVARRETLEREHRKQNEEWDAKERDWRERDALRGAAIKNRGPDLDRDGVSDRRDPVVDRDRDGVDDRREGRSAGDLDRDGVPNDVDRRPADDRRA